MNNQIKFAWTWIRQSCVFWELGRNVYNIAKDIVRDSYIQSIAVCINSTKGFTIENFVCVVCEIVTLYEVERIENCFHGFDFAKICGVEITKVYHRIIIIE